MKAATRSKYGLPEKVLHLEEISKPRPGDNEVLIRVHAASVNRTDCHVVSGRPFFMRFFTGLVNPRLRVSGSDFAGVVVETGASVTDFKVGDKVMGFGGVFGIGSHAEYLAFPQHKGIVTIPENINFRQAAGCLEGSFYAATAVHFLCPSAGQNAMVYGATGAIGSAYVQFLKHLDLHVTAVCSGEQAEMVKGLGADKVIDYKKEDFTRDTDQYDYVIDAVGKTGFLQCKRLLKRNGIYIASGKYENLFWALLTRIAGSNRVALIPPKDIKGNLRFIKKLVEEGKFHPLIDRAYPFDQIRDAFRYVRSGQKIGNVIVEIDACK